MESEKLQMSTRIVYVLNPHNQAVTIDPLNGVPSARRSIGFECGSFIDYPESFVRFSFLEEGKKERTVFLTLQEASFLADNLNAAIKDVTG